MNKRVSLMVGCLLLCMAIAPQPGLSQSRGIGLQSMQGHARTPYKGGYYRALVIGNDIYRDHVGVWPSLKTAVSGARAVSDLLTAEYGFSDVKTLVNATRGEVLKALEDLSRRALPEDSILVYYAGHGFVDEQSQRGFWVPVDARGADSTTFLRNSTIRDELELLSTRARHTLLISDSCFSGSLLRPGVRGIGKPDEGEPYFKKVSSRKSVQIMTAGGNEFVDDDYRASGHSPFTYFLLNELKNNERQMLTVSELSNNVIKTVANNVEQVPQAGVLYGAGDELGEFIFIRMNVEVEGMDPDKVKLEVNLKSGDKSRQVEVEPVVKPVPAAKAEEAKTKPHLPMPTL